MNIIFRTIIFVIFLLQADLSMAGNDSARYFSQRWRSVVNYSSLRKISDEAGLDILKELANDAVKSLRSINLEISFDIQLKKEISDQTDCNLNLSLISPVVNGDHYFRGFDLTGLLLPAFANLEFTVRDSSGENSMNAFRFEHIPVKWNHAQLISSGYPCIGIGLDSVQVESLQLFYDRNAYARFMEQVFLIHDYYAASALLDSLKSVALSVDLRNRNGFPVSFILLEEINKSLEIIRRKKFRENLPLHLYDPKNFIHKFEELDKLARSLTMTFEENLEQTGVIRPAPSADSIIGIFFNGMLRFINWTLLVNDRHGRIYQEYLKDYFEMSAFGDDTGILKTILRKSSPDEVPDSSLHRVFRKVQGKCRELVRSLISEQRFAEAIELMRLGERFAGYASLPVHSPDDEKLKTQAVNGIYTSYIGIAESSVRYHRTEMAGTYLKKAMEFRNTEDISGLSDSLYRKVFLDFVRERIVTCDSMSAASLYEESLDCFENLKMEYDSSSVALISEDLERKKRVVYTRFTEEILSNAGDAMNEDPAGSLIQFDQACQIYWKSSDSAGFRNRIDSLRPSFDSVRFQQYLVTGGRNLAARNYVSAYNQLILASGLTTIYHYPQDSTFDSLWKIVFPAYLRHLLFVSEKLIWMNLFPEAEKFADSVEKVRSEKGFSNDHDLTQAIAKYRSRIGEKKCMNAKEAIEIYSIRAEHYLERRNYLQAEILLDSAWFIGKSYGHCNPDLVRISVLRQQYSEAARYQRSLAETDNLVSLNSYTEAIERYKTAEMIFRQNNIAGFGLECKPLAEFIRGKSDLRFIFAAIDYFIEKKEFLTAFDYLKLYRLQDGDPATVKEQLKRVGKELAIQDFRFHPEEGPAVMIRVYISGDRWMAGFERSYHYQWNILRNEARRSENE